MRNLFTFQPWLTWDDIDFEKGILTVNKTVAWSFDQSAPKGQKFKKVINEPKTKAGNRVIPLLPRILELLAYKKKYDTPNERNLLYTSLDGGLIHNSTISDRFIRILEEAGIDKSGLHPHSLRHTFATRGLENGIELKVMQDILGHASIKMTSDIYTHVLPDKRKESIMKLNKSITI